MKDRPWSELREAIRVVLAGKLAFSGTVTQFLLDTPAERNRPRAIYGLTDRELEVFEGLGSGRRIRDVANALNISPKTVESHVAAIKRKLGIGHINELIHRATLWKTQQEAQVSRREA